MPNYKEMYFELAGKVATAIDLLVQAQQDGEDSYVNEEGRPPILLSELSTRPAQPAGLAKGKKCGGDN